MARVLIIDDDEFMCQMLAAVVQKKGHDPSFALNLKDGLNLVAQQNFDVVFLDVMLPDGNGLDAIPKLQALHEAPEIIIITGFGDPDGAELAITKGAWDYIEKTSKINRIALPLTRALQYREKKLAHKQPVALKMEGLVGTSPRFQTCLNLVAQAAASDANALIAGPTGTGKELFARAIHLNSPRSGKNFVVVDCAALPENLVESVLFGYEKGSFTGAEKASTGLISQAHGGTLFLDEVGELPQSMQKAFLRVLQERRFRSVGGKKEMESDFRLIAATNQDLEEMVHQGKFREDLFFRLRSLAIDLPSLKERKDDLDDLTLYHAARLSNRQGMPLKGFSPDFLQALAAYDWPGNVRELVNALESALAAAQQEPILFAQHLPAYMRSKLARASIRPKKRTVKSQEPNFPLTEIPLPLDEVRKKSLAEVERLYLCNLVQWAQGDINKACRISGLSRPRLYSLLKQYKITPTASASSPSRANSQKRPVDSQNL